MRTRIKYLCFLGIALFAFVLSACADGGSDGNTGKLALSTTDVPEGDVLSLEITVDSAVLTRSDETTVALLDKPDRMEIVSLQGFVKPMTIKEIPEGNYTKITLALSNPELVVRNPFNPANPIEVPVTFSSPSVELDLNLSVSPGSSTHLMLDFDLASSVANINADTTQQVLTPVFLAPQAVTKPEEVEDMIGTVVSIGSNSFVFRPIGSQTDLTISVTTDTEFEDFEGRTQGNTFASLQVNDVIEVDGEISAATFVAEKVELKDENEDDLEGVILATPADGFTLLVRQGPLACIGKTVSVTVNGSTQFEADADVTLPASLNFASTADLTVGQKVEVDLIGTVDCVLEAPTALAEEVELKKQAIEARVQAVGTSTITIPGSGLLDGASITIQVSGETELDDIENLASLAVNTKIRAKGLLLKDASGNLIILAEEVKDRT